VNKDNFSGGREPSRPAIWWKLLRALKPLPTRALRSGLGPSGVVLLLTTVGRRSALPRVTPLQYELVDGEVQIGAARGLHADWVRNIVADPRVELEIKGRRMKGRAQVSTNPEDIADFLQLRLERHPFMLRVMLLLHGLPIHPEREDLKALGANLALVRVSAPDDRDPL
jgi:deazaflavin-dependent oxidoreductase (nitroreductase family)